MCGIFGYANIKSNGQELLRSMAQQQIHRGPDSEGFYIDGHFGLGIRRLSIIDLATGNQPISNEDQSVWVVCNGEIYNYLELTAALKEKGHSFKTSSDVECIVHLYEEYGIDCLRNLNGMFGLALYDGKQKCLYVARDRLGIKPLYYSTHTGFFLFASELRSLLSTNMVSRDLDWNALSLFLDYMYIPTPLTPFVEIAKLKPGHYLEINAQSFVRETAYWCLEDTPSALLPSSEDEAIEQLTSLLKDSSRIELRADVPVCAFLSGGVDSSAVVAFAAMETSIPLRTYHVYFEGASQKIDERPYAQAVASRYGTVHTEVGVGRNDFYRLIPTLLWHLEEPFGDLASVPTYIISEMASKEVKVCLNGSGGDELFGGYAYHSRSAILKNSVISGLDRIGFGGVVRSVFKKPNNPSKWSKLFPHYMRISGRIEPEDKAKVFKSDLINRVLARDIDGYLQSNVLFLLDKIAMAVSLEGRVPLLDHRFVEIAAHIPSSWKLKKGERKHIFKKMLEPYLPHDVLYRKKEGFGAPLDDWLDDNTRSLLIRIAGNGLLKKNNLLRHDHARLASLNVWDLWKVACIEIWYRVMIDSMQRPDGIGLKDLA